jgi:hypothetical protein
MQELQDFAQPFAHSTIETVVAVRAKVCGYMGQFGRTLGARYGKMKS